MAGGDASDARRRRPGARASPREPASRLAEGCVPQLVGILLLPLEPTLAAVDSQPQSVLIAGRHLAGPQHAARAALEPQQDLGVVVGPPTGDKRGQVRTTR